MPTLSPTVKRVLSIAFVAAVVFLGAQVFKVDSADCELVFRFRKAPTVELVELQVRLYEKGQSGELVGEFKKYYQGGKPGPQASWPLVISAGRYRLEGEIVTGAGSRPVEKEVELVDGEAQSVYLDRFLE